MLQQTRTHGLSPLCLPGSHIAINLKLVIFDGRRYSHGNDIMRLNQCSGPPNCVTEICLICKISLLAEAQMRCKTVAFLSSQIKVPECQNDISQTAHSWEIMGLLNSEQRKCFMCLINRCIQPQSLFVARCDVSLFSLYVIKRSNVY